MRHLLLLVVICSSALYHLGASHHSLVAWRKDGPPHHSAHRIDPGSKTAIGERFRCAGNDSGGHALAGYRVVCAATGNTATPDCWSCAARDPEGRRKAA